MKAPFLFCSVLLLITSCVFMWKAESPIGQMIGYSALILAIVGIGTNINSRLKA